jgi:hypothetical protein
MPGQARVVGHPKPLRGDPDREVAALDPMVAQVRQPAHTHAAGHVQGGAAREDRERQPVRAPAGDPGQAPQRVASGRQDRRRHRIRGDLRQRPVEVAHDEEPAGRGGQRADGGHGPLYGGGVRIDDEPLGTAAAGDPHVHGFTVTPGRIAWSPRAITSGPIPPSAASRTIPWASMK